MFSHFHFKHHTWLRLSKRLSATSLPLITFSFDWDRFRANYEYQMNVQHLNRFVTGLRPAHISRLVFTSSPKQLSTQASYRLFMLRSEEKSINDDYERVTKTFAKLFTQLQFQSELILVSPIYRREKTDKKPSGDCFPTWRIIWVELGKFLRWINTRKLWTGYCDNSELPIGCIRWVTLRLFIAI